MDKSGIVFGAPESEMESMSFTVTAENTSGEASCEVKFAAHVPPPKSMKDSEVGEIQMRGAVWSGRQLTRGTLAHILGAVWKRQHVPWCKGRQISSNWISHARTETGKMRSTGSFRGEI